ncbi:MAG: hypothetical protein ACR2H3_05450 [Acidimicrobiales bacterium]
MRLLGPARMPAVALTKSGRTTAKEKAADHPILDLQRAAGNRSVARLLAVQRFGSAEHKMMGDVGSGTSQVTLAPGLEVSFGDLTALAGDYFGSPEQLKKLAGTPGSNGKKAGTADEVEYALHVRINSHNLAAPKVRKGEADFSGSVKDAVKRRYLLLASTNLTHFTNPDGKKNPSHDDLAEARSNKPFSGDKATDEKYREAYGLPKGYAKAGRTVTNAGSYRQNHLKAIEAAVLSAQGAPGNSMNDALMYDGFASHFLTDAYSSGHVRTERSAIGTWWNSKVPMFWTNVKLWMAEKTAFELEKIGAYSVATPQLLWDLDALGQKGAVATVESMVASAGFPDMHFGDIVSKAVHDYDNVHGVSVMVGDQLASLVGDGVVLDNKRADVARRANTAHLAQAGVKASVGEIHKAFSLAQSGTPLADILQALKTPEGLFAAEQLWPRPMPDNSPYQSSQSLPWRVDKVDDLFTDARMAKAMQIAANEIAAELPDMISLEGAKKVAFQKGVIDALGQASPAKIAEVLTQVVRYTPGSATGSLGGVFGHDEDDNARSYYDRAAKVPGGVHKLSVEARVRLIRQMLSGSTTDADEDRILGLLQYCPTAELATAVAQAGGWRRLWEDIDGAQLGTLIHRIGPRYWQTQGFDARAKEIKFHADGVTTEHGEEMIVVILRLCTPPQVRALAKAYDLDWNLDGKEQKELDRLRRQPKVRATAGPKPARPSTR